METTVLITGASSGIGAELAKLFASDGSHLILVSRKSNQLDTVAGELRQNGAQVTVIPTDLSVKGAAEHIVEQLDKEHITLDVLVNNAGFGAFGAFAEIETKTQLDEVQVNVLALTHLTRLLLPGMIERKSGRILNVASVAGFLPGPFAAVYYATKAYVISFSEALASELQGTGVTATVLCPGATKTAFFSRAGREPKMPNLMTAAAVAQSGYDAVLKGRTMVIPGLMNSLLPLLLRLFPRRMITAFARRLQK